MPPRFQVIECEESLMYRLALLDTAIGINGGTAAAGFNIDCNYRSRGQEIVGNNLASLNAALLQLSQRVSSPVQN